MTGGAGGPEFRIHVGGLRELRRDLRAVSSALPRTVLPAAGRKAAELVLPVAIGQSPVATGALRRSHRVLASQRRASVAAGGRGAQQGHLLLFGTGQRTQRTTGRRTGRVQANPWLFRAIDMVGAARIVSVYDQELRAQLRERGLTAT